VLLEKFVKAGFCEVLLGFLRMFGCEDEGEAVVAGDVGSVDAELLANVV
jgi:hypothetical protein